LFRLTSPWTDVTVAGHFAAARAGVSVERYQVYSNKGELSLYVVVYPMHATHSGWLEMLRMSERNIDQALVERVQKGDKAAFDILVLKYQHKLIKLVNRYVRDPDEAMDVAQEAFLKAYRAINRFRGESAFYTWIYRIAINTAKNYLVASGRRPPNDDIDAQEAEQYEGATSLKEQDTPERLLLKDEIHAAITQAIEELPDDLRTAITLRELEGMSYEEIAQTMECPIGTVRSRIFRARDAIDSKLQPLLK
jgi:RNA polymerase sigma-70 factor (ECF subfamily)